MRTLKTQLTNHQSMELRYENSSYYYDDRYSHICYKQLETVHEQECVPVLAIYTKLKDGDSYRFVGTTSYDYLFVGNATIVDSIKSAMGEDMAILNEYHGFNAKLTLFRTRMVLRNSRSVPNIGDVYPCIEIMNSYDGSKIVELSFGIALNDNRNYLSFRQTLGTYTQRHLQGSRTKLVNVIGGYINGINDNVVDFIHMNTSNELTTQTIVSTLDLIKAMGQKRHNVINRHIADVISQNRPVTSWDMFLAISSYTATEKNLNAKSLLENVIESLLVVPSEMKRAAETRLQRAA